MKYSEIISKRFIFLLHTVYDVIICCFVAFTVVGCINLRNISNSFYFKSRANIGKSSNRYHLYRKSKCFQVTDFLEIFHYENHQWNAINNNCDERTIVPAAMYTYIVLRFFMNEQKKKALSSLILTIRMIDDIYYLRIVSMSPHFNLPCVPCDSSE